MPLLDVKMTLWVIKMDKQVWEKIIDERFNFSYLNKGGIAEIRNLEHLILRISNRKSFHYLLWDIKKSVSLLL